MRPATTATIVACLCGKADRAGRQAVERDRRRTAEERLQFEWLRERAAAELVDVRDAMGRARDPERQALARAFTTAAEQIRGARTAEALRAAIRAAVPYDEQARAWKAARDQAHAERERLAVLSRQQRELERATCQQERERALLPVARGFVEVLAPLTQRSSD